MQAALAPRTLAVRTTAAKAARRSSVVVQAARTSGTWYPGNAEAIPSYLDGSLPGDFGFDPLGLAKSPESLKWYVQAELQNGRWAMLGVAGILGAELTGHDWYTAGADASSDGVSTKTLLIIELILFHFVEINRLQDFKNPGSVNQDPFFSNNKLPAGNTPGYPGGIFDFAGFAKDPSAAATLKVKEIKNARLAMLAFLGFLAQHATTGKGPLTNLADHLADPFVNNVLSNKVAVPASTFGPGAFSFIPGF